MHIHARAPHAHTLCPCFTRRFLPPPILPCAVYVCVLQKPLLLSCPAVLPSDWEALSTLEPTCGLCAFLAVPICIGSEVVGVLTLADDDAGRFSSPL